MSLILYSTSACHLCEQAEGLLQALQGARPELRWRTVDIAEDDALFARYGCSIPVLKRAARSARELAWPFDLQGLVEFLEC